MRAWILSGALVALFVIGSAQADTQRADLAALYPGHSGQASDAVKARWDVISNRTLVLMLQCLNNLSAQRPHTAIEYCNKALNIEPTMAGGYKLRAEAHFMLGELKQAKADFDTAVRLDPADPQSYAGRGDALRNMHRYALAIGDYSRAIAIAPDDERLWNARCWTRAMWGKGMDTALDDCDHALGLNDAFALAYNSRGLVYIRMDIPKLAIRDYDSALRLLPDFPFALYGRAIAESRFGRAISARRDMNVALALDPAIARKYAAIGLSVNRLAPSHPKPAACPAKGCGQTAALTVTPRAVRRGTPVKLAAAILAGRKEVRD